MSERRLVSMTHDQYLAVEAAGIEMLRHSDRDAWKLLSVALAYMAADSRGGTTDARNGHGPSESSLDDVPDAVPPLQPSAPISLHEYSKRVPPCQ